MPNEIYIYRDGFSIFVKIDGQFLPADWIDSVRVDLAADADALDTVTVVLHPKRVKVASTYTSAATGEVDDGQAERQAAPQTSGQRVRVPVDA